jgi:hypothetical protein
MNPAKIPIPPNEGIGLLCNFRSSSGTSKRCLASATRIIIGIAEYVIKKAITEPMRR